MFKSMILAVILSFLFFPINSYANFDKAMAAYTSGDFKQAKTAFETLSAIGHRSALFNLGVMYFRGEGVKKDPSKAIALMQIANENINDESFSRIISSIYKKLDDEQKQTTKTRFDELNPIYNISNIEQKIYPKPLDDKDCAPEFVPVKIASPKYPHTELKKGGQGKVTFDFTVSPEGYARDAVVKATMSDSFTKAAAKALSKSRFQPAIDGEARYGRQLSFSFQMRGSLISKSDKKKLIKTLDKLENAAVEGNASAQYVYASELNILRSFKEYLSGIDLQYKTANEWLAKAAENGLANAQYELGRNMLLGRGCEVDQVNAYKWINAAAYSGYSPAQKTLAQLILKNDEAAITKSESAIRWLKSATQSSSYEAKILLAWELSTSVSAGLRDGTEAIKLLNDKPENYFDDLRILETKAAAYAAKGDFRAAEKLQLKAKKLADKRDWVIPLISKRLETYQSDEAFSGSYY